MKKINIEKLLKKIKPRKKVEVVVGVIEENQAYENLQLPMNHWLEEVIPSFQRK